MIEKLLQLALAWCGGCWAVVERARETHREIGASVRELENRSQRIESGVGEIEDTANDVRAILERDRASLAKGREVIRAVEKEEQKQRVSLEHKKRAWQILSLAEVAIAASK